MSFFSCACPGIIRPMRMIRFALAAVLVPALVLAQILAVSTKAMAAQRVRA